jgi:AraC family transcriptional regulator
MVADKPRYERSQIGHPVSDTVPLPENVVGMSVARRRWNGVEVAVTKWHGAGTVTHRFPYEQEARLVTLIEEVGGHCEPRLRADRPCAVSYSPRHMDFAPADMEMWGFSDNARFVRDATLIFDFAALSERLATRFDAEACITPRLRFSDDRIWPLVKMLSEVVSDQDPTSQLYGDGLIAAIAARLFARPSDTLDATSGLAPWQLRLVVDRMEAELPNRVELADLAAMAGLSQSHFSRAFKTSTGFAPYQWQLHARIKRAQTMLVNARVSLEDVAEATGFADAMHFGRTFRKFTGATPAAWRRDRIS